MKIKRIYDTNEYVLVVRKSDYENGSIGKDYFLVSKEEWFCEDNDTQTIQLLLTKVVDDSISMYLVNGVYCVIMEEIPQSRKREYIEI